MNDEKSNPDLELASEGARVALKAFVKGFAAVALAIVFAFRGLFCDPTPPDGLEFKYWGEHCGPGHGTDGEPVDDLDAACFEHDRAVP